MRIVMLMLSATLVTAVVAGDPPKPARDEKADETKDKVQKVTKKFYACWLETEEVVAGTRQIDPERLCATEFDRDALAVWPRRGELASTVQRPGPRIDPTADPMRLDIRVEGVVDTFPGGRVVREDEKLVRVLPCVFKFVGDKLVIAYGDTMSVEKVLNKGEDYPGRPTDFTSTKKNKRTVVTMKPCSKWDQD